MFDQRIPKKLNTRILFGLFMSEENISIILDFKVCFENKILQNTECDKLVIIDMWAKHIKLDNYSL